MLKAKAEGKFLIGNIGRLTEQKGMEYFIRAVPAIRAAHPEAQCYIIGAGEDEEKLRKMSEGLPVKFLGYRSDVQSLMSQLDLIALSSLWEGLPLTPIEAFSVGKTIVATEADGTPEVVADGENGLLVPPRDPAAIAEKINWIMERPAERKRLEKNAKDTFERKFSFDVMAQAYKDYYRSL